MLIARLILITAIVLVPHAASSREPIKVPSDPASWNMDFLGLPKGSDHCPGGEIKAFKQRVPQLQPFSPKQYESSHPDSLGTLRGVQDSDELYPFYFRWDLPSGGFAGVGGFILARGECIIHVQATEFDN